MFNFLKRGTEYVRLANTFNFLIEELQRVTIRSKEQKIYSLQLLGFLTKKGVFDRIEEYKWSLATQIQIDKIDRQNMIPLSFAIQRLYLKLMQAFEEENIQSQLEDILSGKHESYISNELFFSKSDISKYIALFSGDLNYIYSQIYKLIK